MSSRNLKEATEPNPLLCFQIKEAIEEIINVRKDCRKIWWNFKRFVGHCTLCKLKVWIIWPVKIVKPLSLNPWALMGEEERTGIIHRFRLGGLGDDEETFLNYQTKYIDLYDGGKARQHQRSRLPSSTALTLKSEAHPIDLINVAFALLSPIPKLKTKPRATAANRRKPKSWIYRTAMCSCSKRELIEKFIEENLPDQWCITSRWVWKVLAKAKVLALAKLCDDETVRQRREQFKGLIDAYIYNNQEPIRADVLKCLGDRPSVLESKRLGIGLLIRWRVCWGVWKGNGGLTLSLRAKNVFRHVRSEKSRLSSSGSYVRDFSVAFKVCTQLLQFSTLFWKWRT